MMNPNEPQEPAHEQLRRIVGILQMFSKPDAAGPHGVTSPWVTQLYSHRAAVLLRLIATVQAHASTLADPKLRRRLRTMLVDVAERLRVVDLFTRRLLDFPESGISPSEPRGLDFAHHFERAFVELKEPLLKLATELEVESLEAGAIASPRASPGVPGEPMPALAHALLAMRDAQKRYNLDTKEFDAVRKAMDRWRHQNQAENENLCRQLVDIGTGRKNWHYPATVVEEKVKAIRLRLKPVPNVSPKCPSVSEF